MRTSTVAILLAACLGLLGAQWSGVHTHVNADGFGELHGMYGHHHHQHGGDDDGDHADSHDDDVDVTVVDYGLATKLFLLFLAFALPLTLTALFSRSVRPHLVVVPLRRRRARWRPPSRAPPYAFSNV
jgi:hypothetical protein